MSLSGQAAQSQSNCCNNHFVENSALAPRIRLLAPTTTCGNWFLQIEVPTCYHPFEEKILMLIFM
jgi:hypothetical protein